jgi:hypothetical protein
VSEQQVRPWLDDENAPPEMRALMAHARGDGPRASDLERLARKLAPAVGAGVLLAPSVVVATAPEGVAAAASAGKVAGAAATKLAWLSALKMTGVACVVGVGAAAFWPHQEAPKKAQVVAPVQTVAASAKPVARVRAAVQAAPEVVAAPEVPEVTEPARAAPADVVRPRTHVQKVLQSEALPSELSLIQAAQAAAGQPAKALHALNEHARIYPQGVLSQEREVLAISALLALGKRDEAEARAERPAREHPDSAHLRRVRVLLDGAHAGVTDGGPRPLSRSPLVE